MRQVQLSGAKIALTCSGLSHVRRGVEAWSEQAFEALRERGVAVTLFKGSGDPSRRPANGGAYSGSSRASPAVAGRAEGCDNGLPDVRIVPCVRRGSRLSQAAARVAPPFGWRFGVGSAYQLEQTTFVLRAFGALAQHYDIIHTKDPQVALLMHVARKAGLSRAKVILNHGTEEPPAFLNRFDYIQHLAPAHLAEAQRQGVRAARQFVVPNFVDTELFQPGRDQVLRAALGIPREAVVVLCVAAIKRHHKRVDWLLQEAGVPSLLKRPLFVVVAGAKTDETESVIAEGRRRLGGRVVFLVDHPRERMPQLYRMADVFVLCSLKEMLANASLEALASGLPCLMHREPVAEWVIGAGGWTLDMTAEGALAGAIARLQDQPARRRAAEAARQQARKQFAKDVVLEQQVAMYREALGS